MNRLALRLTCLFLAVWLSGCAQPQLNPRTATASDSAAVALVKASQQAQGAVAFKKIRQLKVRYEGRWAKVGPRFQPILADTRYRGSSEEVLDLKKRTISQRHNGPAGEKTVLRAPAEVVVAYDGRVATEQEIRHAAALVGDAYTMFLLGPHYFTRPGAVFLSAPATKVDGRPCDQVLAILRPGFGFSQEDRVLLAFDRSTRQLLRVRMTLNGLDTTIGAEIDVTFRDFRTIGGLLWPTDFDERIRIPFDLHAHHWRLVDLQIK
jgi:hypothetical protein